MTGAQAHPASYGATSSLAGGTAGLRTEGEVVAAEALVFWAAQWETCRAWGLGLTTPGYVKRPWPATPWMQATSRGPLGVLSVGSGQN